MSEGLDLTMEKGVLTLMRGSKSEQEWNNNCDKVKESNGGNYPNFWFRLILMGGEMARVSRSWQ
jgi:hypothetical protein